MCAASSWQTTAHATPARAARRRRRGAAVLARGGGGDLGRPGAHLRGRCGGAEIGPQEAQPRRGIRRATQRAVELHQVLRPAPPAHRASDPHPLEIQQDGLEGGRAARTHEHVHVLQIVVIDAGRVQAAKELAEPGREAPARRGTSGREPLPVTIRRDRARHLPGDEEAPPHAHRAGAPRRRPPPRERRTRARRAPAPRRTRAAPATAGRCSRGARARRGPCSASRRGVPAAVVTRPTVTFRCSFTM